ncbi:hypothetical protein BAU15_03965 [Enterococcus sp. JM4C]|uniref:hypothetical protein n=1 Tax=Candidatus Enterococcus huntleyi TaxID=1857217 RepID=UPI0013794A9F|nr:hypothetical protein [Enterococcus sp. JM4C]KAF1295700.1 hypothetical protein BAU15_03965 [Enterococcus sp. JM4C]
MKINLQQQVDSADVSLIELAKETGISYDTLLDMYTKNEFDENTLSVTDLTNLMIAFDLTNINRLVPDMK